MKRKPSPCGFRERIAVIRVSQAHAVFRIIAAGFVIALSAVSLAAPQQIGQNAQPDVKATATIKASTQLVVETVVVKDKKGNPVEGLTAKDFTVTENGTPQTIGFCEHQEMPVATASASATPRAPEDV